MQWIVGGCVVPWDGIQYHGIHSVHPCHEVLCGSLAGWLKWGVNVGGQLGGGFRVGVMFKLYLG